MTTTRTRKAPRSTNSRPAEPLALREFTRFCAELKVEDGAPFKLHPFQKAMLRDYFGGVRETCLIIPKKNGKSTLLAALALYHLLVTPNADCIMVAASRDQADIILRQARMFVRGSPALRRVMRLQQRSILSTLDEGRIRILASDVDTVDGQLPTLAIVDELHRHKRPDLYGTLMIGTGPRHGRIITISTAASQVNSPLGRMRERGYALPGLRTKGKYRYARSKSLSFHEWALDPTEDTDDLRVVKRTNPAPWRTLGMLEEEKASITSAEWLRLVCGIWTESENPWLEAEAWDRLVGAVEIEDGAEVWAYVKKRGESAAIVVVTKRADRLDVWSRIWNSPVGFEVLEAEIREICERWKVRQVLFHPWELQRSAELLETEGLPMIEFPNTAERMAPASTSLQRVIEGRMLRHSGDPDLRAHVLAGTWRESPKGRWIGEDPVSRRSVLGVVALASVVHVAGIPSARSEALIAWA